MVAKELKNGVEQLPKKKTRPAGSISDRQMRHFQRFLERWVLEHCVDPDGSIWSQRRIAESLGVTQNEFSAWMNDRARPGLPRVIRLYETTRIKIEDMLGLEPPLDPEAPASGVAS